MVMVAYNGFACHVKLFLSLCAFSDVSLIGSS